MQPGDKVFVLMGRLPELYVAVLGALKARCVVTAAPFSAFVRNRLPTRIGIGGGKFLVTTPELYRRKVASVRDQMPTLEHVILVGDGEADGDCLHHWEIARRGRADRFQVRADRPGRDGATAFSQAARQVSQRGQFTFTGAVVAHHVTGLYAL